jgi:hypothetical protein
VSIWGVAGAGEFVSRAILRDMMTLSMLVDGTAYERRKASHEAVSLNLGHADGPAASVLCQGVPKGGGSLGSKTDRSNSQHSNG